MRSLVETGGWNSKRRQSSASMMCVVRDRETDENSSAGKPFSLSSKYCHRLRKCSLTQSIYTSSSASIESLRVYACCLRADIEYKTVRINKTTTARKIISGLLKKFKMKHVDPRLFFLTLEFTVIDESNSVIKISDDDIL